MWTIISVIAGVIAIGAQLVGQYADQKVMKDEISKEVAKQLGNEDEG